MRNVVRAHAGWLLGFLLGAAAPLAAQSQTPAAGAASLRLRVVSDSTGAPLPGVSVQIEGAKKLRTLTDAQGYASLREIPAGWQAIALDMLGFAPLSMSVDFEAGKEMGLQLGLAPEPIVLRALEIRAEVRKRWLTSSGFYERRRTGLGTYMADSALDAVAERVSRLSDMMRGVRGVRVVVDSHGNAHLLSSRGAGSLRGPCSPRVYLDGLPADQVNGRAGDLDGLIFPNDLAAVEVYAGPSEAPPEYGANAPCGVVLLWTKKGK
ncbi:MAG TPA: TonB-dependent receptor plug domain-containing protein [Longimicrobiales bacterium]|nr:TonB-dependent receptor plug domain-containing protein [Longimicrobiales bacterium]